MRAVVVYLFTLPTVPSSYIGAVGRSTPVPQLHPGARTRSGCSEPDVQVDAKSS